MLQNPLYLSYTKELVPVLLFQNFKDYEISAVVTHHNLPISLTFFKKNIGYQFALLSCISGVDLLQTTYRFLVSYDLLSISFNFRLRVKTFLNEYDVLFSSVAIFINSNWWEREIWDMFGIFFDGHPDLRRLLTDYGFEGYPLRKDFPVVGYNEIYYNHNSKTIMYKTLQFSQETRSFVGENL